MSKKVFESYVGYYALLTALTSFLYAVSFIVISRSNPVLGGKLSALFLLLTGFFTAGTMVGIFNKLQELNFGYALWAMILGLIGAVGMMMHGGYDLANAINPPMKYLPALADFPSQVDPRGLMSFGIAGVALFKISWLMKGGKYFPQGLANLGYLSAFLLLVLYLGRLIILKATSPIIVYPALLNGFIVGPWWYLWLGKTFLGEKK